MNLKSLLLLIAVTFGATLRAHSQSTYSDTLVSLVCYDYDLPSGQTVDQTGSYHDTLKNVLGQDSIYYTIYLTVLNELIDYKWDRLGGKFYGDSLNAFSGNVVSLSADGQTIAISSPNHNNYNGRVKVFKYLNGSWTQLGNDINGVPDSRFGFEIALSDDGLNLIVGMPGYDHNPAMYNYDHGAVRVYHYANGQWNMKGSTLIGNLGAFALFGYKVDISEDGNIIVVGIPIENKVKTYKYTNSSWTQLGSTISGETSDDDLGISVSCSRNGEIIALGSDKNNGAGSKAGHTRVYKLMSGSYWSQMGSDIEGVTDSRAGTRVRVSPDGSTVAMGSAVDYGFVKVVRWNNNDWTMLDTFIYPPYFQDAFTAGLGLSYSGDTVVVGSPGHDENGPSSGRVDVFTLQNGKWEKLGDSLLGDTTWDRLGTSTAISYNGQFIAAGAPNSDEAGTDAGWSVVHKIKAYEGPLYTPDTLHVWGCPGAVYTNGGTVMNLKKVYYDSFPNAYGCDSFEYTWFHGDTIAPTARTRNDTIYLDSAGKAVVNVDSLDDGSIDDCAFTLSLSKQIFDCSEKGDNQMQFYVYDASGNIAASGVTVTVIDTIAPFIKARSKTLIMNAQGTAKLDALSLVDSIWDNCGYDSIYLDHDTAACSAGMIDTVVVYVIDASGNVGSDTVIVHLKDVTPPVLALSYTVFYLDSTGYISLNIEDMNGTYTDNCMVDSAYFAKGIYDCNNIGLHWDTAFVTDRAGNISSTPVKVFIGDTILPWLTTPLHDTVVTHCNASYLYDVPVNDNCASLKIEQVSGFYSGSSFPEGKTTNKFKVTDKSGNNAYFEFDVTVQDRIIPMRDRDTTLCRNTEMISFSFNPSIWWAEHDKVGDDSLTLMIDDLLLGTSTVILHYEPEVGCFDTFMYAIHISDTPEIPQIIRTSDTSISTVQEFAFYQWYSNGSPMLGETDRDLTGMGYGYYTVVVYTPDSCATESEEFHFYDNSSIEELQQHLLIYPNPVEDELIIDATKFAISTIQLLVYDVSGRLIFTESYIPDQAIKINTMEWKPGVYFIRINLANITHTSKTIKVTR